MKSVRKWLTSTGNQQRLVLALWSTMSRIAVERSNQVRWRLLWGISFIHCFLRFAEEIQCGDEGRVSPLCSSLTHLNMLRCLGVELAGLQVVCKSLRRLQNLQAQETLMGWGWICGNLNTPSHQAFVGIHSRKGYLWLLYSSASFSWACDQSQVRENVVNL